MATLGMGRELLFLDPREVEKGLMYTEPGNHILIIGATGSGKTSTLLKVTYNLWKEMETVIWRDDANLEFLSVVHAAPIKLYLPEGCDLHFERVLRGAMRDRVERAEYDWHHPEKMFPTYDRDKFNVLLFDLFTTDPKTIVTFWTKFFWEIYRYKRAQIRQPWALVVDELNDLAPGKARGTFTGQLTPSSRIYSSLKKFRKMNLRVVGTTHNYNDLHAPLRGQFNYNILKRMRRDMVPSRFFNFAHTIERMKVNECIIVDRYGNYQMIDNWTETSRWHIDPTRTVRLKPLKYKVPWSGEVVEEEAETEDRRSREWRNRALLLIKVIDLLGYPMDYKKVAGVLGLSKSYSHEIRKQAENLPEEMVNRAMRAIYGLEEG